MSKTSDELEEVVAEGHAVRLIEDDIYSVLPDTSVPHHYDKWASVYDSVVSTRLYNFVMWGTSPYDYVEFARQALNSTDDGIYLDAGCGSLLFTGRIYVGSNRRIVAFDQSLAMLTRARQRLRKLAGCVSEHIRELFVNAFGQQMSYAEKGNMAFVRAHKKTRAL